MYATIKTLHIVCVSVSILGFIVRGVWMLMDSPLRHAKPARILPHIVDTVLLMTGITLSVMSRQYPVTLAWLNAKIIGLLIYIALGFVALKLGKTKTVRAAAFVAAILVFGYIFGVARAHHVSSWLAF